MRWQITIIVLSLVLAISLGLYRLESQVQQLERDLAEATAQLEDNRRNSRILAAEWSFLSQPGRVQALARRHLALRPLAPLQVGSLAALPMKSKSQGVDGAGPGKAVKGEAAGGRDREQRNQPPLPGWKPAKPRRGERIVLASTEGQS